jgi:membrane-associated protease RseP (regulator of RpoE activity)
MSAPVAVTLFVIAILVVILIHEAAHFGMAKLFGIKVEEFFLGFGPRLWSTRRGETEYGVKALPFGGYVRIAGMNPFQEPTPEELPRTFGAKPAWQRALVIVAGPATHFVIAFVIMVAFFALVGQPRFEPVVSGVDAKLAGHPSPASVAGLQKDDLVIRVDRIRHPDENQLIDYTKAHVGRPMTLVLDRHGRRVTVTVTPVHDPEHGTGRIGVLLSPGRSLPSERSGPVESVGKGGAAVGQFSWAVIQRLGQVFGPEGIGRIVDLLFGNAHRGPGDVTSVVGVARAAGQASSAGDASAILLILASVNVFVGILNLVPLPPFDGGHLAVLAYEKIRRRKVDMRRLVPVTAVVAAFLVLFMVSVLYLDIVKPLPNVFR